MLYRNGKLYICFSPHNFLLPSSNCKRSSVVTFYHLSVTFYNLIPPTQKNPQPAQTTIPRGKMTPVIKITHVMGKTRGLCSFFQCVQGQGAMEVVLQYCFTFRCLKSTAGLILPKCLSSHFLRRQLINTNKNFTIDIE